MHDSIEFSIVIVTWNSEFEIEKCLNSIIEDTKELAYEIIVIDNNSSDRTSEILNKLNNKKFNQLKLIFNTRNLGFTKACNQGLEIASGKNILLLNPDTKIINSSLKKLIKHLNSSETIGAVAPQLLNEDGTIQKTCRNFPTYFDMFCELSLLSYIFPQSKTFNRWKMNHFAHDKEKIVAQPMGAALMIKEKVLRDVGNFDEQYFMFFNDVDLCKKIYEREFKIIFYPEAKIIHKKGASIYKDRAKMIKVWNNDCLKYFKKHDYNFFLCWWLSISLYISGFLRIIHYKLTK